MEAIRRRKSYRRFRGFLEFLETGPAAEHILYRAHALVDEYHGFGSRVASGYARECIDLLVAERRERR